MPFVSSRLRGAARKFAIFNFQFSIFIFALVSALLSAFPSAAQTTFTGKLKNFRFPDYYPPAPGRTNQALKTLLNGAEAQQLPDGKVQIGGLRIESFREDGRRELEVRATECIFEIGTREAFSGGHLEVVSASGLFAIEGEGFRWRQSDGSLFISNRVVSTLNRGLLASRTANLDAGTNLAVALAALPASQVVRITSDRCEFNSLSNVVTQTGHVVADDPQMQLGCEILRVQFTAAKRPEEIVAVGNVSILNKPDQSRATSGRAVYAVTPDKETVTLTEKPAWHDRDGRQEMKAEFFTYDMRSKSIRAEGHATMQLPRGSMGQPVPALGANGPSTTASNAGPVQITSDILTILLPATNRLYRSAVAENNVVILSPADGSRGTGDKAAYNEGAGLLELLGHAQWLSEGRTVQADVLAMGRTNHLFTGRGHAFFKVPLSQVGQAGQSPTTTNRVANTNLFLEVSADDFGYQSNRLSFRGNALARFLESKVLRGQVTCGLLTAHFAERLDSLLAEKHVVAEHYPPLGAKAKSATNFLSCEVLSAKLSESGQVVAVVAADNVQAAQIAVSTNQPKPTVTQLTCGLLTAVFLPQSSEVDKLHAEEHVLILQGDKQARGADAIYTAAANVIELTGQPSAEFADGKVRDADVLLWDRNAGIFRGRGKYRLEWNRPLGQTNRSKFFGPK